MRTFIKYIKQANMWVHISISDEIKGKTKTVQKWFGSEKEAEDYHEKQEREHNKENDEKGSSK